MAACTSRILQGQRPAPCARPASTCIRPQRCRLHIKASCNGADIHRRHVLTCGGVLLASSVMGGTSWASDNSSIQILKDEPGVGTHPARKGDLILFHYTGMLKDTGVVFDGTRGGQKYRDGGPGVFRPLAIRLGGDPVPGICAGLRAGLEGMTVGGKRTFEVPPELGFKGRTVGAPFASVPPNSTLIYEVELVRLSTIGPDALTKGIERCGQGGGGQQTANCAAIKPEEFI